MRAPLFAFAGEKPFAERRGEHGALYIGLGIVGHVVEQNMLHARRIADEHATAINRLALPNRLAIGSPRDRRHLILLREFDRLEERQRFFRNLGADQARQIDWLLQIHTLARCAASLKWSPAACLSNYRSGLIKYRDSVF